MKIGKQYSWISSEDFGKQNPQFCFITGVDLQGKDLILQFKTEQGLLRQMSLWGNNRNLLVTQFGEDTDLWINKKFVLNSFVNQADGKNIKQISF